MLLLVADISLAYILKRSATKCVSLGAYCRRDNAGASINVCIQWGKVNARRSVFTVTQARRRIMSASWIKTYKYENWLLRSFTMSSPWGKNERVGGRVERIFSFSIFSSNSRSNREQQGKFYDIPSERVCRFHISSVNRKINDFGFAYVSYF